jgi:uncharacterized protein YfbU (UPF0304 family)
MESEYLSYVHYLVDGVGLWKELRRDSGFNSHSENFQAYRKMMRIWQGAGDKAHLTKDEMEQALQEAPVAWDWYRSSP